MVQRRYLEILKEVKERRAKGASWGAVNVTGAGTANAVFTAFRIVWLYAKRLDGKALGDNPCGILRGTWRKLGERERVLTAEEMPVWFAAVHALDRQYRDLLTLALYTGWRDRELCGLRWSELDLTKRTVSIPAERMKTGRAFKLPLSRQIADLLIARRALGWASDCVFPSDSESGHTTTITWGLRQVAEATGVKVGAHDLRRTFITTAQTSPIPAVSVKYLVAHARNDVTERYTHLSDDDLRSAVQVVADRISDLVGDGAVTAENVQRIG
jgi:integrase